MATGPIPLEGWQSWSHCTSKTSLIKRVRNFSPFGGDNHETVPDENIVRHSPISGWCSWNSLMLNVNEIDVVNIAQWINKRKHKIPLEYILIDDGWTYWGDWTEPDHTKFPQGIKGTVEKLHSLGFKSGIWIAPYLADPRSSLFKEHPDWFLKDKKGGFIDGKKNYFFDPLIPFKKYLLDLENDQVYAYTLDCFKTMIKKWNIKLLKIDFLYAGHFDPRYRSSHSPDRLLKKLLTDIKKIDKEVILTACGCPLSPAAGIVDAMRISDDVILPPLKNLWPLNHLFHTSRLNQLKDNYRSRKITSHLWLIDPDMFVCHPGYGLNDKQILEFRDIITDSKDVLFLGDYLPELTEDQLERYIYPIFE